MPQIEGPVEDVVFRNEQNGWTVLTVQAGREHITCVGELPPFAPGERLRLTGEWAEHRDYGKQLRISSYESVRPTTSLGIEKYLGSGVIRGIGPATAKLIVRQFGKEALHMLDDEPRRLLEIPGIGAKRAAMIEESYKQQRDTRETMVFLSAYGVGPSLAARILREFGDRTQAVVRGDPYLLAERVEGVGFRTADAIAASLGVEKENEHRLTCGLTYALEDATRAGGHTYLPRELLFGTAKALLQVNESLIERVFQNLVLDGRLIVRNFDGENAVYTKKLYEAEGEVAARLTRLMGAEPRALEDLEARLGEYERDTGVTLDETQRETVLTAAKGGLTVITGGPGTGKTTCIRCLLRLLDEKGTLLCAPTGRAAKRMMEATGTQAQTIHRLLKCGEEGGAFTYNEENPLKVSTLIVDEVSMVDLFLMQALLRALPAGTRLVLVGDADQLPSVGAGNVLRDIIDSGACPIARMKHIHRQQGGSMIVENAHRINAGELPCANRKGSDFFFERAATAQQAAQAVESLLARRLPAYLGADGARDIQVMAPMKKGEAGVWALNRMLQRALNPPDPGKAETRLGDGVIRVGDKVMQVRNNYDIEWTRWGETGTGVFNGDIGFVKAIDEAEDTVEIVFDDDRTVSYGADEMQDIEMAYCISVHKSQGSEFGAVVLPLVSGPPMLMTRNLLYTAVTRAKRLAVLVGREECVGQMVGNNHIARRFSALNKRLAAQVP